MSDEPPPINPELRALVVSVLTAAVVNQIRDEEARAHAHATQDSATPAQEPAPKNTAASAQRDE